MSDEKMRLKIGEHVINDNGHNHAYATIAGISDEHREQLFKNAHNNLEHGGEDHEYKLLHNGKIHKVYH